MTFNKILVFSFGLVLLNTNINAMESNNIINCENNNKLSISKQENFEINGNSITTQSRLSKIEKKIDEILDIQKILKTKISIDNNILQDDMKKLKQDVLVSSSILESFNKMAGNINTNTKQINKIQKSMKNSNNSISNSLETNRSMNTHMLTTLIEEVYKQKNTLEENNKMICYLVNLTNQMYGLSQVFSQSVNYEDNSFQNNNINNINNIINTNNIQNDNCLDNCQ